MRRRSILLLAGGLLLAVSPPVFGVGDEPAPDPDQSASTTTTTVPDDPGMTDPDPGDDTTDPDPGDDTTDPDPGDDTTDPDPGDDSTDPDPGASSNTCDTPERVHAPAPAEGESEIYESGEAGVVEVRRTSATGLEIVEAVANDGWTAEVRESSGPRVKARFSDAAGTKVRFAASLDDAGEEIHIRVSTCP